MSNNFAFQNTDMSGEQAASIWNNLKSGLIGIQDGNAAKLSFEQLYRSSYTLVLHKHGEMLYSGVKQLIITRLQEQVCQQVQQAPKSDILPTLVEEWERHKLIMNMFHNVLMYMDKMYCERYSVTPVYALGCQLFLSQVIEYGNTFQEIMSTVLRQLHEERVGGSIDRLIVRSILSMMDDIDVYETFETSFLNETRSFYQSKADQCRQQCVVWDYLAHVEQWVADEENRLDAMFHARSKKPVTDEVLNQVLREKVDELLHDKASGLVPMLEQHRINDLGCVYRLLDYIPPALDTLRSCLGSHLRSHGESIVSQQDNIKDPSKFVTAILELRSKYMEIVDTAFFGDRSFFRCIKESFEHFINLDTRSAQFLSIHVDRLLQRGFDDASKDDVDRSLEDVITVFRYVKDKDVFEDFYKQHLASRLLAVAHTSRELESNDAERAMIAKLKAECGHQFTSKLEEMFKNIQLSAEVNAGFQKYMSEQQAQTSTELAPTVLTSGYWPFPNVEPCMLPASAEDCMREFERYYADLHPGRRLAWQTSLGTAELVCQFEQGKKELHLKTYQMSIMTLFNEKDTFSFREMQDRLQIPERELQRHVLSLAHPKLKILLKRPNTKRIEADHTFTYNINFTSPKYRIKVRLLSLADATGRQADAKTNVPESVLLARKGLVDAAIVRIMKSRQQLEHSVLISEVMKQLQQRFDADPTFIKKNIESLIEREYMRRSEHDRRVYEYLA